MARKKSESQKHLTAFKKLLINPAQQKKLEKKDKGGD